MTVHTSDTIMRIGDLPQHLLIVGGFVAAEFAHVFSSLGSRVTLVIRGGTMPSHCDDTICERFTDIAAKKWEIRSHRNMVGAHHDGSAVVVELDDGSEVSADAVLVATGRVPNGDQLDADTVGVEVADGLVVVDEYQRTTARGIFALGDVCSPYQLKHVANHEARVVKHNLLQDWDDLDNLRPADHRYVPSAVFTDPQIACVGLSETRPARPDTTSGSRFRTTPTWPTAGRWRTPPASPRSSWRPTPARSSAPTSWATRHRR